MNSNYNAPGDMKHERKTARRSWTYASWCLLWAITLVCSDYLLENEIITETWTWPIALLPIAIAPMVFFKYYQFFSQSDELTQRIQHQGLAIGFALGLFYLMIFVALEPLNIEEPDVNDIIVVFAFAWSFGQIFSAWRYR